MAHKTLAKGDIPSRMRAMKGGTPSGYSNVASDTTPIGPAMTLSASGYKVKGVHHVDLSWGGAGGTDIDIKRNVATVVTTANDGAYTDNTGNKGAATYTYQVCEAGTSTCSNTVTIVF